MLVLTKRIRALIRGSNAREDPHNGLNKAGLRGRKRQSAIKAWKLVTSATVEKYGEVVRLNLNGENADALALVGYLYNRLKS